MVFYTFIVKKTQPTFAGIDYWILSNFFIAIGYLLLSQRDHLPYYLTIILSQFLFLFAGIFRVNGLIKFFDIKRKYRSLTVVGIVCILLYIGSLFYFTYIYENLYIRTVIIGFFLSGISIILGILILKNRPLTDKYVYIFTSLTFFTFSFIFLFRIIGWIVMPSIRGLFISGFINDLQFVSSIVIDISWTTMFFVMHNQKLTRQLQESEEQFRVIFTQNSSALALIDYDTTISLVNDAYCQMSGYTKDEVIGMSWTKQLPSDELERLKEHSRLLFSNPEKVPEKYEFSFYRKDGQIRHGLMSISVIPSIKKMITSFTDITERKTNEIKLQNYATELDRLNRGKDRFLSILAHDLKGPFSSLINFSELLLLHFKSFDKEKIEKQLDIIFQTARKTYNLLEDLLIWSTSNLGKLPFEPKMIDFRSICIETIEVTSIKAMPKGISVNYIDNDEIVLFADVNMLKAILRNLVSNAIKFTNTNGRVDISIEKENSWATITVKDNGVGISQENQKKLWDISKNFTTYGTANEKGTGLGLMLCKELVEKHGGRIWVESEINKGSSFKFTLPLFTE